jgi:hypothetical protein
MWLLSSFHRPTWMTLIVPFCLSSTSDPPALLFSVIWLHSPLLAFLPHASPEKALGSLPRITLFGEVAGT